MRRLWAWLRAVLLWLLGPFRRRAPAAPAAPTPEGLFRAREVDEQPDDLAPRVVYVVGEGEHRWLAAFLCPCGCGATVILNLVSGMRPRWEIELHEDDLVTLTPSISRVVGCRSHFFIRRGRVEWCGLGVS